MRIVACGRDPTLDKGKSVKNPSPEEEREAGTMCDELTTVPTSHSPSPCHVGWEEVEKSGVKLSSGRREGWEAGVLGFDFISHYPTLLSLLIN